MGKELEEVWSKIPMDTNVLITHGPPNGYGDYVNNSLSYDEKEARELFELIKKDHTALEPKKIVLESIEIEK